MPDASLEGINLFEISSLYIDAAILYSLATRCL